MARTKAPPKKTQEPTEVAFRYDLAELPTAFHRAGLAGLVMLFENLADRKKLPDGAVPPEVDEHGAAFTFTESLLRALMDDVYDAKTVEAVVKNKWPGAEIVREPTAAETEAGTRFVHHTTQPCGTFFNNLYPDADNGKGLWLKLWRDMLWNVPRSRPANRIPYNQRAAGGPCGEGLNAWVDLLRADKARAKNEFQTGEVSSALLLGAQSVNAEGVPFVGRVEQNLLLHFWPLAVLLFVPREVETDGTTSLPPSGYSVVIPDVSHLKHFVNDYGALLRGLDKAPAGYRPAGAVIDVAAEGGLAFFDRLAHLVGRKTETGAAGYSIASAEYLHLVKAGNNVKTMAAGRVSPRPGLIDDYHALVDPPAGAWRYGNPVFRRGLLLALLGDEPDDWWRPFARTLATFEAELFVRRPRESKDAGKRGAPVRSGDAAQNATPGKPEDAQKRQGPPLFAADAAAKFREITQRFNDDTERTKDMPDAEKPRRELAVVINAVVRRYLMRKTEEKSGVKPPAQEGSRKPDYSKLPPEFNDAKQKLALGLMLEFRSRKEQAFTEHFAATFFSVSQRLPEADRLELAAALTTPDRLDDVKTLTLLSLSANS